MRVNTLRAEIEKLTKKFETLEKDHAVLNVNHKTLTNDHKKLNDDYGVLAANLQKSQDIKQTAEDALHELNQQYKTVNDAFVERDQMMINYRKKYEEEARRLCEIERIADQLEIQKRSLEKQNEIQRKQLLDKIMQQNE